MRPSASPGVAASRPSGVGTPYALKSLFCLIFVDMHGSAPCYEWCPVLNILFRTHRRRSKRRQPGSWATRPHGGPTGAFAAKRALRAAKTLRQGRCPFRPPVNRDGRRGANASVRHRISASTVPQARRQRCRARKLSSWCAPETFRQHHLDRADAHRSGQRHDAPSTTTLRETAEPGRSLTAPQSGRLNLRLYFAARMHEIGIIDAQPAGADQRQVLDAGRIGERYEDVRLLHLAG